MRNSREMLDLPSGTTVPRADEIYAATEYGVVCLNRKSEAERARTMISRTTLEPSKDPSRPAPSSKAVPPLRLAILRSSNPDGPPHRCKTA